MAKAIESTRPPSAVEVLHSLDLEGIRAAIAELERERDAVIEDHQRQIDALKILEKAADVRENGNPLRRPRGPRKKKPKDANGQADDDSFDALADRVETYLQATGPQKKATIATDCKIESGRMAGVLADRRFVQMADTRWGLRGQR